MYVLMVSLADGSDMTKWKIMIKQLIGKFVVH